MVCRYCRLDACDLCTGCDHSHPHPLPNPAEPEPVIVHSNPNPTEVAMRPAAEKVRGPAQTGNWLLLTDAHPQPLADFQLLKRMPLAPNGKPWKYATFPGGREALVKKGLVERKEGTVLNDSLNECALWGLTDKGVARARAEGRI